MSNIVYFAFNDWNPTPKESERLSDVMNKDIDAFNEIIEKYKLCINLEVVDMSCSNYITCERKFFEECFPELLPLVKEEPYDFLWIGDKKMFLEYKEENVGYNFEVNKI